VELIPNYATLLILENDNIIFSTRLIGAGKRSFVLGKDIFSRLNQKAQKTSTTH